MKRMEITHFTATIKKTLKVLGVTAGVVLMLAFLSPFTNTTLVVDVALADASTGQQGHGKMMSGGQGGNGGKADQESGSRSGAKGVKDVVLADEGDDDSDRPIWAGGNPTLNPHSGGGEGKPDSAGTMKGDFYGDLIVLVRDPETGEPILDPETGELQVCLDEDCNDYVSMVDGEIPASVTPVEVDFGRAAVARSPDKVTDRALTEALSMLTAEGVILSTDTAGRISYTIDGLTKTIDSPLENLALYTDLMAGLASNATSDTEAALGNLATLETAAALLAGVADKTGDISLDYLIYGNVINGVVPTPSGDDYYDFSKFDYSRSFPDDYTYFYMDGEDVKSATLNINDYLTAINGELPTGSAALFAAAADDAVEVIELIHTQIHDALIVLP